MNNRRKSSRNIINITKNSFFKRNGSEIKSVSTNVNKEVDEKRKIILIPKLRLNKKENEKVIVEKNKPIHNYLPTKTGEIKIKSKVQRTIIPYKLNELENATCQICKKNINNMSNAIFEKSDENYYHFECVTGELKKYHNLRQSERIAYIGNNTFAIIEDVKNDGRLVFKINQKLQYSPKINI